MKFVQTAAYFFIIKDIKRGSIASVLHEEIMIRHESSNLPGLQNVQVFVVNIALQ